jgi:ankyrin repeat protein
MSSTHSNPLILAADKPAELLRLLQLDPSIASAQDEHGYSLVHAAASYNHLDLLRTLVNEYKVDVNIKDEDGETALFGIETVDCARVLVEELNADTTVRGEEGQTARERIEEEGDFPELAVYLRLREAGGSWPEAQPAASTDGSQGILNQPTHLPNNVKIDFGTVSQDEIGDEVVDPEFKRRIEELAARGDFDSEEGQEELRRLVTEAIHGQVGQDRDVRQRTD